MTGIIGAAMPQAPGTETALLASGDRLATFVYGTGELIVQGPLTELWPPLKSRMIVAGGTSWHGDAQGLTFHLILDDFHYVAVPADWRPGHSGWQEFDLATWKGWTGFPPLSARPKVFFSPDPKSGNQTVMNVVAGDALYVFDAHYNAPTKSPLPDWLRLPGGAEPDALLNHAETGTLYAFDGAGFRKRPNEPAGEWGPHTPFGM